MSDIIRALKEIYSKVMRITEDPNDVEYIINETIAAVGKDFNLFKELGGNVPNNIQIKCAQNFILKYSMSNKTPDRTWPLTNAAGSLHTWKNEGYYQINITPALAAVTDGYVSGKDKAKTPRGN